VISYCVTSYIWHDIGTMHGFRIMQSDDITTCNIMLCNIISHACHVILCHTRYDTLTQVTWHVMWCQYCHVHHSIMADHQCVFDFYLTKLMSCDMSCDIVYSKMFKNEPLYKPLLFFQHLFFPHQTSTNFSILHTRIIYILYLIFIAPKRKSQLKILFAFKRNWLCVL
jgi:hypothetical protein